MGLRLPEVLIILVVLVLVFGANKIPQLGDALGKGIRNFKKASSEDDSIDVTPKGESQAQLSQGTSTTAGAPRAAGASEKKA
jgi:sec-independent protein translocase protein TatA